MTHDDANEPHDPNDEVNSNEENQMTESPEDLTESATNTGEEKMTESPEPSEESATNSNEGKNLESQEHSDKNELKAADESSTNEEPADDGTALSPSGEITETPPDVDEVAVPSSAEKPVSEATDAPSSVETSTNSSETTTEDTSASSSNPNTDDSSTNSTDSETKKTPREQPAFVKKAVPILLKYKWIILAAGVAAVVTLVATLLLGVFPARDQAKSYRQQLASEKTNHAVSLRVMEKNYLEKEEAQAAELTTKKQAYDDKMAQLNDQAKEEIKKKITPDVTNELKTELKPQVEADLTKSLEPEIKERLTQKYTQASQAVAGTYEVKESGTYLVRIEEKYYNKEYTAEQIGGQATIGVYTDNAAFNKNQFEFSELISLNVNKQEATVVVTQGQVLNSDTPYTIKKVE